MESENKVSKSLMWVCNQIPNDLGNSPEEKMLKCIKLYCKQGAGTINELESNYQNVCTLFSAKNEQIVELTKENIKQKERIAELEKENKDYYDRLNNAQAYIDNHEEVWKHNTEIKLKQFAERVKMEFYYEFDELIPSIMADKIDKILKELQGK